MGDFWGITADGWVAIATLIGAAAVVLSGLAVIGVAWYGTRRFLGEQEARDVRRYLVDEGVWKLKESLDRTLQTVRLNYGQCLHLLRLLRDLPAGHPGAPRLEDLPRLFPMDPREFAFDAIRPASLVLHNIEFGPVATSAFARIFSTNGIFANEVEQSVRTYYSGELVLSDDQRRELYERLSSLAKERYYAAEKFLEPPGWLEDAGLRIQIMRVSSFDEIEEIQKDPTIVGLGGNVREMYEALEPLHEEEETAPEGPSPT